MPDVMRLATKAQLWHASRLSRIDLAGESADVLYVTIRGSKNFTIPAARFNAHSNSNGYILGCFFARYTVCHYLLSYLPFDTNPFWRITMKVLSSLITAAVVAQAAALTKEEQLRLLRKAKPLSARKLQENNAGAYVTTADSIKFNACVSLTALPEQGDQEFIASSDYMKGLFEAGDIVSQTSAVLFSICATADCSTDTSEENLYVTDLGSFMQLTGYRPQKTFDYCEACKQSQDYCAYVLARHVLLSCGSMSCVDESNHS
jgi:hypothetical protein